MISFRDVRALIPYPEKSKLLQLDNYKIKLLAAFLMVIDHIGIILFPSILPLRIVGRLSFPLFAWLLAQGERYTQNFARYLFRLLGLGLISQPIYYLAFSNSQLNILFTLAIGLVTLRLGHSFPKYRYLSWGLGIVMAELLPVAYGGYGVFVIVLMAGFRSVPAWWLGWTGLHLLTSTYLGFTQLATVVAPLVIQLSNGQRGASVRWFYSFYPLHLLVLFLIFLLLQ